MDKDLSNKAEGESGVPGSQTEERFFQPSHWLIVLSVAILSFTLYFVTLAPTITGEDSGEFVTAAALPGIPHPPGYPLYCMVGHLFSKLPWGETAWRVNLMSAVFASLAVALLALTIIALTRSKEAAFFAALAFACSRDFWGQAVIAEVYTMNLFFVALCFLLLLLWSEGQGKGTLYAFAFFLGLGTSLHNTFLLLIPPCSLFVLSYQWTERDREQRFFQQYWKTWGGCALLAACALSVYLYLPLRSRANPFLDWGNPETLSNFLRHLRRTQYDFMFSQYPRSLGRFLNQLLTYGRFGLLQFGLLPAVIAVVGMGLLLRRRLRYAVLLLSSGLLVICGFCFWQNFEQTREWLWVMRVFGIPAYYSSAIALGAALAFLAHKKRFKFVTLLLGLFCIALPLYLNYRLNDKSGYYWAQDYGENLLYTMEEDAIFISDSDHASFSILYLQAVCGLRPDVINLRKYGYLEGDIFEALPDALRDQVGEFPARRHEPELIVWLAEYTQRPLYLSKPIKLPAEKGLRFMPFGLVFRLLRPGEEAAHREYAPEYHWRNDWEKDRRGDYTADTILYELEMAKAQECFLKGRDKAGDDPERAGFYRGALQYVEAALKAYGRDPVVLNNAGVLCARYKLFVQAAAYFEEALQALPHSQSIQQNLDKAQARLTTEKPVSPV